MRSLVRGSGTSRRAHPFGHCTCESHVDRPWRRPEHWTDREVAYLERWYGLRTLEALARHLKRPATGVYLKAKRLGLRTSDAGYSARELGRWLGVEETIVSKLWIKRGWLKAARGQAVGPHISHRIRSVDVVRFIEAHPQLIDPDRAPADSPFRDVAQANRWITLVKVCEATGHAPEYLTWYIRSGLVEGRRRGRVWYVPEAALDLFPKRDPEAIADSLWRRKETLRRRAERRARDRQARAA